MSVGDNHLRIHLVSSSAYSRVCVCMHVCLTACTRKVISRYDLSDLFNFYTNVIFKREPLGDEDHLKRPSYKFVDIFICSRMSVANESTKLSCSMRSASDSPTPCNSFLIILIKLDWRNHIVAAIAGKWQDTTDPSSESNWQSINWWWTTVVVKKKKER